MVRWVGLATLVVPCRLALWSAWPNPLPAFTAPPRGAVDLGEHVLDTPTPRGDTDPIRPIAGKVAQIPRPRPAHRGTIVYWSTGRPSRGRVTFAFG